ncbi:unnamed protein product, partial [Ectocarpus sp. 12 AP-2014]
MECTVGKDADEETGGGDGVSPAAATAEPSELAQQQPASAVEKLLVDDMTVQEAQYASEPQLQQQQDPEQPQEPFDYPEQHKDDESEPPMQQETAEESDETGTAAVEHPP